MEMDLSLRKITKDNYEEIGELHLPDEQQEHLSENIWSIAESQFHETHEARGVYLKQKPVGFIMWVRVADNKVSIWRFMVAHKHQKQGIGRSVLSKAIKEISDIPGVEVIEICYSPENEIAKRLYFSLGFKEVRVSDCGEEAYANIDVATSEHA